MLAEADTESIVWVSRNRKRAVTAPKDRLLGGLYDTLGTQFNLRLARTLRTKCVLFVEGKDAKLLRLLASTVGATRVEREDGLTAVSLEGIDRADHLDAFAWLIDDVLEKSVKAFVLLDRDYRDSSAVKEIERRLRKSGVTPHFWERHELENYLLMPGTIARVSGADQAWIEAQLAILADGFEDDVYSGIYAEHQRRLRRTGTDDGAIGRQAKRAADAAWGEADRRIEIAPGKELLGALNQSLQAAGHKTLRTRDLSRELAESEVPSELRRVLREVDAACH